MAHCFFDISRNSQYDLIIGVNQVEKYSPENQGAPMPDIQKITGTAEHREMRFTRRAAFDLAREIYDEIEESVFTQIRFDTIPGYYLEEHNKDERAVWDDMRTQVIGYFDHCYKG